MTSPGSSGAPPPADRERRTWRLRATLPDPGGAVWALAWGQLGDRPVLASGGRYGLVRLWDPERGEELRTLTHPPLLDALAWGHLGDRPVLASGGRGGAVRLWDPERGEELATLPDPDCVELAWGQLGDRPVLASGGGDTVRLWDPMRGEELCTLTHPLLLHALAWGQLGDRPVLASGGAGMVRLWDPERGEELRTLNHPGGDVLALAWGHLGDRAVLASGGGDTVRLWDPERGEELRTLTHPSAGWALIQSWLVIALAWGQLADRPVLASGGRGGPVRLWDPERGEELATLLDLGDEASALAWGQLHDRPVLASGGGDTVRLWDPMIEHPAESPGHDFAAGVVPVVVEVASYIGTAGLAGIIGARADAALTAILNWLHRRPHNRRKRQAGWLFRAGWLFSKVHNRWQHRAKQANDPLSEREAIDAAKAAALTQGYALADLADVRARQEADGSWRVTLTAAGDPLRAVVPPGDPSHAKILIISS